MRRDCLGRELRGQLVRRGLRRREGVATGGLALRLGRERSRARAPSLVVDELLHLVRVLLGLRVGELRVRLGQAVGHVWRHAVGALGVEDG